MQPNQSSWSVDPSLAILKGVDRFRRLQGAILEALGAGPMETPCGKVTHLPGLTLKTYEPERETDPVVLLVPAPIKRAYIWDLVPWASVVKQCLKGGARVYLIEWKAPCGRKDESGLEAYADRFIGECLDVIGKENGQRPVFLAGHSLGGTLAAIFAALHPGRIKGLILLGAPLNFEKDAGVLAALVKLSPRVDFPAAIWSDIPGSGLNALSCLAAPFTFVWLPWQDRLASFGDDQTRQTHLRVRRWLLDELPFDRCLFEEVIGLLYGENRFMLGTLQVRNRPCAPQMIETPVLSIVDPRCPIVPIQSVLPFLDATRSADKNVLWYEGDTGVALQHVGMLVGKTAHSRLWPEIMQWVRSH